MVQATNPDNIELSNLQMIFLALPAANYLVQSLKVEYLNKAVFSRLSQIVRVYFFACVTYSQHSLWVP